MNKFPFHPFFRYEVEYDEHRLAIAHEIGSRFLDIDMTTSLDNLNNGNTGIDADDNKDAINNDDDSDGRRCEIQTTISIDTENINKTSTVPTPTTTATTATNPVETELCNNTTANNTSSSCSNNHKHFQHHNGDGDGSSTVTYDGDGGGGGGSGDGGGGDNNDGGVGGITHSGSGAADGETTAGTTTILVTKLNGNSNKTPLSASDEFVLDILNDDLISRVRNKINSGSKELFEPCVKAVKAFLAGEPFQEFETSMYFHR